VVQKQSATTATVIRSQNILGPSECLLGLLPQQSVVPNARRENATTHRYLARMQPQPSAAKPRTFQAPPGCRCCSIPGLAQVCRCCSILGRTVLLDCSPGTVLRAFPYHRNLTIRKQYLFPRRDGGLAILTAVARDGSDHGTGHATRNQPNDDH
jgi:hypothetical protein